jgi:hypothetical protein
LALASATVEKKWYGSVLQSNKKFIVRLKYQKDWGGTRGGKPKVLSTYTGTITSIGSGEKDVCQKLGSNEPDIIFLQNECMARPEDDDDFTFRCRTWLQDYTFNIKTKRFVSVFVPRDYVQRETAPSDAAPAIFGGSCTKFE